jgi:hypothetical protein
VVGASRRVATAVWVGNIKGFVPIRSYINTKRVNGGLIRHDIFRSIALTVDANPAYRGTRFPTPSPLLLAGTGVIVPDVANLAPDAAVAALREEGFAVRTGAPIDSVIADGRVAGTAPAANQVAREGALVTVFPSKTANTP